MDRVIVYPSEVVQDLDELNTNRNLMIGLGVALQAALGPGPYVNGLACAPVGGQLKVTIGAGAIYFTTTVDATPYGTLPADTTDQIVKQGLVFGSTSFNTPAPGTAGQSIVYLIEAQYQDVDGSPAVLPYYNASNPSQPYNGPGNSGSAQNTVRSGVCALQIKAGTAAATGTQVPPSTDAGWTALWTITIANGATQTVTGNIAMALSAPFVAFPLGSLFKVKSVGTTQSPTFASSGTNYKSTAPVTINLPARATVTSGVIFGGIAQGGAITFTANGSDTIAGGSPGGSFVIPTAGSAIIIADDSVTGWALFQVNYGQQPVAQYINASSSVLPGTYLVDTSAGPITLTEIPSPIQGSRYVYQDVSGTFIPNPLTINQAGNSTYNPRTKTTSSANIVCVVRGEQIQRWFDGANWRML